MNGDITSNLKKIWRKLIKGDALERDVSYEWYNHRWIEIEGSEKYFINGALKMEEGKKLWEEYWRKMEEEMKKRRSSNNYKNAQVYDRGLSKDTENLKVPIS